MQALHKLKRKQRLPIRVWGVACLRKFLKKLNLPARFYKFTHTAQRGKDSLLPEKLFSLLSYFILLIACCRDSLRSAKVGQSEQGWAASPSEVNHGGK